jgi:hypothetical protein
MRSKGSSAKPRRPPSNQDHALDARVLTVHSAEIGADVRRRVAARNQKGAVYFVAMTPEHVAFNYLATMVYLTWPDIVALTQPTRRVEEVEAIDAEDWGDV